MEKKVLSKVAMKRIELNVFEHLFHCFYYRLEASKADGYSYELSLVENPEDNYYKERLIENEYEKNYINSLIQMLEKQI